MRPTEKDVAMSIEILREDAGIKERDKKIFAGNRYELNGKIYLRYKEVLAEGEEAVSSMLIIDGNELKLHRKGDFGGDMHFLLGKVTNMDYKTPMGKVPMRINTSGLDLFISEQSIEINLEYDLIAMGTEPIHTIMTITAG